MKKFYIFLLLIGGLVVEDCKGQYINLSGYAFIDLNNNGIWDPGEPPLANQAIYLNPLSQITITNDSGYYSFWDTTGDTVTLRPDSLAYALYVPDSITVIVGNDTANLNFAFHYIDTLSDVRVFAAEAIQAQPGHLAEYYLVVNNHGARTENGRLIFIFDSHFAYISSSPSGSLSGDTVKWNFSNLLPGTNLYYDVFLNTPALSHTIFSDTAFVSILNHDSFPSNNIAVITDSIINNYQRNNKTVSPKNYNGADFQAGDYLDYNITFQNTDTVGVNHVWIIDTLSQYLDMSSLYIVAASAPYTFTISGNALRVDFFYNINSLPDSATNQAGSHGFFNFMIRPLPVNFIGNIPNIAYIYLDSIRTCGCGGGDGNCTVCISNYLNIYTVSGDEGFPDCEPPILGDVFVSASNGNPPYTYDWSNGEDTAFDDNLTYGQYYVTVTDFCHTTAVGMSYVDSLRIVQVIVEASALNLSCGSGRAAVISVCDSNGGPYTYHWSNGATTDTVSGLNAGYYYCTVSDASGDSGIAFVIIDSASSSTLTDSIYIASGDCYGNAVLNVNVTGGSGNYYFSWNDGLAGTAFSQIEVNGYIFPSEDTCTVTDIETGCKASASFNFIWTPLAVSVDIDSACNGVESSGIIFLNVTGGNPWYGSLGDPLSGYYYNYQWDFDNGIFDPYDNYEVNLRAGIYTCTVYDAFGCSVVSNDTVSEEDSLYATANIRNVNCFGNNDGEISLSIFGGTPGYTFWWGGDFVDYDDYTRYNLGAGNYICIINDSHGCEITDAFTVTQPPPLTDTPSIQNAGCNSGNNGKVFMATGGGTPPYTYRWSNIGNTSDNIDSLLAPGVYSCTIFDFNDCSKVINNLTVGGGASLAITSNIINDKCFGADDGSINLNVSAGSGNYTYSWSNSTNASSINLLTAGTYFCNISDTTGCALNDTFTLTQPAAISVGAQINASCYNSATGSIVLDVSGGTGIYTYHWSNNANDSINNSLSAGSYICTITDANRCMVSDTFTITQFAPLTVSVYVASEDCFGNAFIDAEANGGSENYSFSWSAGASYWYQGFSQDDVNGDGPGGSPYEYTCTVTDIQTGCEAIDSVYWTWPLTVSANIDSACNGIESSGNIYLNVTGGSPAYYEGFYSYNYQWWFDNGIFDPDNYAWEVRAGIYTCTVYDGFGCSVVSTDTVSDEDSLYATANIQNVNCFGNNDGEISLSIFGGTGQYFFYWSIGDNHGHNLYNLAVGNYTCNISDSHGCEIIDAFTVTQPPPLTDTPSVQNAGCNGGNDGKIFMSTGGGTPPYTYRWSNIGNASGNFDTSLAPGVYSCTITDSNQCSQVINNLTVSTEVPLSITPNIINDNCFGSGNGSISLDVLGGTGNYSYSWSNQANTSINNYLTAGTYFCTVSDNTGCIASDTFTVTQPAAISISAQVNATCYNFPTGSITLQVSGGTGNYNYLWPNGFGNSPSTPNFLSAGTYFCTITDANGCMVGDSFTITRLSPLTDSVYIVSEDCYGDADLYANAIGGLGFYYFSWSVGVEGDGFLEIQVNGIINPQNVYTCTVTDNETGCEASASVYWTWPITVSANVDNSCNDENSGSINLSVTGGTPVYYDGSTSYNYQWWFDNGIFDPNSNAFNLSPGIYTCTVYDAFGCSVISNDTVGNSPLTDSVYVASEDCQGDAVLNSDVTGGSGIYYFSWNDEGGFGVSEDYVNGVFYPQSEYTCTVTDVETGCEATDSVYWTWLTVSPEIENDCNDENNGQIYVDVTGGTPIYDEGYYTYNFQWATDGGDSYLFNNHQGNLSAGIYYCTVYDAFGCSVVSTDTVGEEDSLYATANIHNVNCFGNNDGEISLSIFGGTGQYIFYWSNGDNQVYNIYNLAAGDYICTIKDYHLCEIIDAFTVTQPPPLTDTPSIQNASCYDSTNGSISLSVSGGMGNYTYNWSNNANDSTSINEQLASGFYICTITDSTGCSVIDSFTISTEVVSIAAEIFNGCYDSTNCSITLNVSGGAGNYSFHWSNNTSDSINNFLAAGNYTCTVTDARGCMVSDSFTITKPDSFSATFTNHEPICGTTGGALTLIAYGGTLPYTMHWSNGDGATNVSTVTFSNISAGVYYITVTDKNGCIYDLSDTIPCITGIEYVSADDGLNIFPNPANNMLILQSYWFAVNNATPVLYDITGKEIAATGVTKQKDEFMFNISTLAAGVYFIKVNVNGSEVVRKFVKL